MGELSGMLRILEIKELVLDGSIFIN